jgi:endonuclease III
MPRGKKVELAFEESDAVVAPPNWEDHMAAITAMRSKRDAPVDSLGCEGFFSDLLPVDVARFHVFVGALLSSQTKDPVTAAAIDRLRAMDGGLTVDTIRAVDSGALADTLSPVGFHRNKAKYLKASAELLADKHGKCVPGTLKELVALPGIGPKMAYLILSVAFGKNDGICVDVS